ncbi:30S ribosomal protein S13 [Candidatus Vidania fulgoroideae]|uniref:30S ribosomal protein S13 n=1 Tax=Candidatus Vidania fulgoroideorum TaxID=881286 RepID=A0A975AE70_9PROT|nr:30S ribosomal protein S13 [Candidatus Vidania fulgoroideae]
MNILGINMNNSRKIEIELTKIYGIGNYTSRLICNNVGILGKKISEIDSYEFITLNSLLGKMLIGNMLKKKIKDNISTLVRIKCYRGIRHKLKLPVRGQRTRSNSRTSRRRISI